MGHHLADFLMCLSAAEELEHSTRVKESIQGGIQAFVGGVSSQGSFSFSPELCEPLQFHTCMAMHLTVETLSGAQSLCKFFHVEFCMCSSSAIQRMLSMPVIGRRRAASLSVCSFMFA